MVENLLLEVITQPARGAPSGIRVYEDGRYDYLSDSTLTVNDAYEVESRSALHTWRYQTTLTSAQLDELRQAIREANTPPLAAHYDPPGTVHDPITQTWRMKLGNELVVVGVVGYPLVKVAALEKLYRHFNQLQPLPPTSSNWRVWQANQPRDHLIQGEAAAQPALQPLVQALFNPAPAGEENTPLPASNEPLLEISWFEQGELIEKNRLYADGRLLEITKTSERQVKIFAPEQLKAIRSALAKAF